MGDDTDSFSAPAPEPKRARAVIKKKPRKRKSTTSSTRVSSRSSSRQNVLAPSPEPIYRSDRSRSTSLFSVHDLDTQTTVFKRRWRTEEGGDPGDDFLSSEVIVRRLMKSYKAYFKNLNDPTDTSFDPHPENYPVAELEYPNSGAKERFILLAPKDKDHYNPIMDLETSLLTIVTYYCTPEQQALFGPLPRISLIDPDDESPPSSPSPSPSPPLSRASSTSSLNYTPSFTDVEPPSTDPETNMAEAPTPSTTQVPLLRALKRAINLQDGPLFLRSLDAINTILRSIKYPTSSSSPYSFPTNPFMDMVDTWSEPGLPKDVLMRIIDENYQRAVGPNVKTLKKYEAFSSTVYGELMPNLSYDIIKLTQLHEDSLFLDLGSGVGNVVVQAALQTGCKAYGVELMPQPARVARDMVKQIQTRARMWGVRIGEMELEEGDMLKSRRVDELMAKADVVLVDNKVFEESLNEALKPKFLDLKEGAIVISLAPFVSSLHGRVTERNVDDICGIFEATECQYHSGSVSWGNNGGSYYVHRVDREGYSRIKERFEQRQSMTRTRTRRNQR